jgi:hypothetical protein
VKRCDFCRNRLSDDGEEWNGGEPLPPYASTIYTAKVCADEMLNDCEKDDPQIVIACDGFCRAQFVINFCPMCGELLQDTGIDGCC